MRVRVDNDVERAKRLFERYVDHQKVYLTKQSPSKKLLIGGGALLVLSLFIKLPYLRLAGFVGIMCWLIMRFLEERKLEQFKSNAIHTLEMSYQDAEAFYYFSADDEGIGRESQRMRTFFKWESFGKYIVNEEDIYLFWKNGELFDIISSEIIGENQYRTFKQIMEKHLS